jgi:hypothetical protein
MWLVMPESLDESWPQVEATYKVEELDIDQIEREEEERVRGFFLLSFLFPFVHRCTQYRSDLAGGGGTPEGRLLFRVLGVQYSGGLQLASFSMRALSRASADW